MEKITEQDSHYRHLEKMSTEELLVNINREDQRVALVTRETIPKIVPLVDCIVDRLLSGGRLFYIGAGTSGRLGIVDASECPPTFGVERGLVVGLMAGGDAAIRKSVEFAEDDTQQCWKDLCAHHVFKNDVVIGIAASGTTPYVVAGLRDCREHYIATGAITCNPESPILDHADFPVVAPVGPEFVTGSTRMKAGTAQKLILNMISTSVMVKLGRVEDNKMVDMQLSNNKLVERGIRMVASSLQTDKSTAKRLLDKYGSVRKAIECGVVGQ